MLFSELHYGGICHVGIWIVIPTRKQTSTHAFSGNGKHAGVLKDSVDRAAVSSVVPNLSRSLQKNVQRLFDVNPLMINHNVKTGLKNETIPPELGNDLLCNAAQAHKLRPGNAVMVCDFGTALTFTTVSGEGSVLGAAIAPGLLTAVRALFHGTAQLPQVELQIPKTVVGRNSEESIRSGIMVIGDAFAQDTPDGLTLSIVDIDHFKNVNDTFGHYDGDLVLKEIAARLIQCDNGTNVVCRWGGEEFAILTKNWRKAAELGEALCEAVRSKEVSIGEKRIMLGVTQIEAGVSTTVSYRLAKEEGKPVILDDSENKVDFTDDGVRK